MTAEFSVYEREQLARENEIWRPVVGFEESYEVSSHGRLRSIPRITSRGGPMKTSLHRNGYLFAVLSQSGQRRTMRVHQMVAEAFSGPRPPAMPVIRHLDGDKFNNRAENLAYGSYRENELDKIQHGRNPNTTKTHCPKGHSYADPSNLRTYKGQRYCASCRNDRAAEIVRCPVCSMTMRRGSFHKHRRDFHPGSTARSIRVEALRAQP